LRSKAAVRIRFPMDPLAARASAGTVTFDVGGQHFKVLRQTIEARPDTLLASLVDDIGTDTSEPIFVDANPERFGHILDWYRYNEMYVQEFIVGAVLRDAKFFLLPDIIKINGSSHVVGYSHAGYVAEGVLMASKAEWPTCDQYVEDTIRELQQHFDTCFRDASQRIKSLDVQPSPYPDNYYDRLSMLLLPEKTIRVFDVSQQNPWLDDQNLCDFRRVWRLIAEIRQRGFTCRVVVVPRNFKCQYVNLAVGLGLDDFLRSGKPSLSKPKRVQICGVNTQSGRLLVNPHI